MFCVCRIKYAFERIIMRSTKNIYCKIKKFKDITLKYNFCVQYILCFKLDYSKYMIIPFAIGNAKNTYLKIFSPFSWILSVYKNFFASAKGLTKSINLLELNVLLFLFLKSPVHYKSRSTRRHIYIYYLFEINSRVIVISNFMPSIK